VRKSSARVGWGLLALGLVGNVAGVVLSVINDRFLQDSGQGVALTLAFGSFLVVGCVLLARRPGNVIGWIFTAVGLLTTAAILAEGYTTYAYITHPGPLPGRLLAVWVYNWIWLPIGMLTVVFPLLLFPTGRPLSARWRPVIWLAVGVTVGWAVLGALNPSLAVSDDRSVANPIGVSGADPNAGLASTILNGLLQFLLAAAIVSVVVRFRRSHGVERQQLKWFAYAGALVVLGMLSTLVLPSLGNLPWVMVAALPVAVGIAILRYRLYDIDRLINRTLVYGSLTAILGLGYAGAVLILGQVFGGVTEDPPSWAVAGTTLAVAALFQPARRRIQAVVDRRFNRRKYNAAKTVETFSARLRDEVDLDALSAELLAVAHQTMQPTMAALWLRPSPQARPRGQGHGS
jgi:MFS family permease